MRLAERVRRADPLHQQSPERVGPPRLPEPAPVTVRYEPQDAAPRRRLSYGWATALSAVAVCGVVIAVVGGGLFGNGGSKSSQTAGTSTGEAAASANPAAGTDLEDFAEALLKEGYMVSRGGVMDGEQAFAISETKNGSTEGNVPLLVDVNLINDSKRMTDIAEILHRNFRRDPGDFYYEIHAPTNPVEDLLAEKSGQYYLWRAKIGDQPIPRARFSRLVRDLVRLGGCGRCVVQMADNLPGGQRAGLPRP